MAWKAKKRSDLVAPIRVEVGFDSFTFFARVLTPQHIIDLQRPHRTRVLNPQTGQHEDSLADKYFHDLFDAIFDHVEGLTLRIVEQMIELDPDADPVPLNGDGETITDREFVKFLWIEAPVRHFYKQVQNGLDNALAFERQRKDLQEKNSLGSSAS